MRQGRNAQGFATRAVHAGQEPDPTTGAVMTPIYATATYAQTSPGVHKGYEYARTRNPTREAFERCVADLEGGARGFAFASGLAAEATVLELLPQGAHIVAMDDLAKLDATALAALGMVVNSRVRYAGTVTRYLTGKRQRYFASLV